MALALNATVELSDALHASARSPPGARTTARRRSTSTRCPRSISTCPASIYNEQFSQEFQLLYDNGGQLTGLVGVYYLDAKADTLFDVRLFTTFAGLTAFTEADVDTETYAVFGDFTYDFTDQLSLSLGGRYTWDKRTASHPAAELSRRRFAGLRRRGHAFGAPSTNFQGSRRISTNSRRAPR